MQQDVSPPANAPVGTFTNATPGAGQISSLTLEKSQQMFSRVRFGGDCAGGVCAVEAGHYEFAKASTHTYIKFYSTSGKLLDRWEYTYTNGTLSLLADNDPTEQACTLSLVPNVTYPGAVFALSNAADGNAVVMYGRGDDGTIALAGMFATGGTGSGGMVADPADALGSANPIILSRGGEFLFAVNAGSDEISVFNVQSNWVELIGKVASGGQFPSSLAINGNMLYVLNSGGTQPNIASFTVGSDGTLTNNDVSRAVDPGSCANCGQLPPLFVVSPGQIGVTPDGTTLVLTVKGTDLIETFALDENGIPSVVPVSTASHGSTPFGFTFDSNGHLLVAEAFGNSHRPPNQAPNAGAVSSYTIDGNGGADVITGTLENQQTTPCWIATSGDRTVAYVADNGSNTLSAYSIADDGSLTLMPGTWPCSRPVDLAMTEDGAFLYTNDAGTGTVSGFSVNSDGTLTLIGQVAGLPVFDGAVGTAVR